MAVTNDVINLRVNLLLAKGKLKEVAEGMNSVIGTNTKKKLNEFGKAQQKVYDQQRLLNAQLDKQANKPTPFAGWAMSIMFAGMAMQRLSKQVSQFGTKAFKEISESVAGTTTNVTMLEGSMKYLGYTIGQSLEPVLAWLIPIVDKVSDWIDLHPGLTAFSITLTAILGTLAMVGGSIVLAYNGFKDLFAIITGGSALASKGLTTLTAHLTAIKMLLGAGAILYVGWQLAGKSIEEKYDAKDWLVNLGLAAIGGFLMGGAAGSAIAVGVTLAIMVSQESARLAVKRVSETMDLIEKRQKGTLTTKEAIKNFDKISWSGTTLPDSVIAEQQKWISNISWTPTTTDKNPGGPQTMFNKDNSGFNNYGTINVDASSFEKIVKGISTR